MADMEVPEQRVLSAIISMLIANPPTAMTAQPRSARRSLMRSRLVGFFGSALGAFALLLCLPIDDLFPEGKPTSEPDDQSIMLG